MAFYLRYSKEIKKDIKRGCSYHVLGLDKSDFKTAKEVSKTFNMDCVKWHRVAKMWVQELPGLCAFYLDAETLEEAAKEFDREFYRSIDMPYWHILEAKYVGDCPEGDCVRVEKLLYSNAYDK